MEFETIFRILFGFSLLLNAVQWVERYYADRDFDEMVDFYENLLKSDD